MQKDVVCGDTAMLVAVIDCVVSSFSKPMATSCFNTLEARLFPSLALGKAIRLT